MPIEQFSELDTGRYRVRLQYRDSNGDIQPLPGSQLQTLTLQVFEKSTRTVLRSRRDSLNRNDVTIDEDGWLTWLLNSLDTTFASDKTQHSTETHVAQFAATWGSTKYGVLENPIKAIGTGQSQVVIEIPGHGLDVITTDGYLFEEHVTLVTEDFNAGGIVLQTTLPVIATDGDLVYLGTECAGLIDWNTIGDSAGLGLTTSYFLGGYRTSRQVTFKVAKGQEALC